MAANGNGRTVRDPPIEEQRLLVPSHILDHASQRIFIVSLFILIQCWKIYDVILLHTEAPSTGEVLTSLNNFSFVLKYAFIDGLFLWLLPIFNVQYLTFSPFKTLLMTILLNGITIVLGSSLTLPFLSSVVLPIWNMVSNKRELTLAGDSIRPSNVIDMDSHFKGKITIQYLPDSSAKFNPFHYDKMCLEPNDRQVLDMPIEFNTTTELGFLQLQHISPANEIKYINFTGSSLNKLLRKDCSHLASKKEYKRDDTRIFYLEVPIKEAGSYKLSKVTDIKNINIRTYKSEFMISYCPNAKFTYPSGFDPKKNYKCLPSATNEDSIQVPLVNAFGVGPMHLEFIINSNGKFYKSLNATIGAAPEQHSGKSKDLSWLGTQTITRNSLEQEILHFPTILNDANEGTLEFQLIEITDYLGNKKRYNPSSKDKDVWFNYEIKMAPKVGIKQFDASSNLLVNGTKKLEITGLNRLKSSDFPLTVDMTYTNKEDELLSATFSKLLRSESDAQYFVVDKPGIYKLVGAKTRFCDCQLLPSTEIDVKLVQPPTVHISATPVIDKCLGTTGYTFDLDLSGKPPFQLQYHVYKNQSNVLRPVHNERGATARMLKTFENKYSFKFSPQAEGNFVIVFNDLKDVNYNSKPVLLDEANFTYLTYFKHVSRVSFFKQGANLRKTLKTCFGATTKIPLYFKGNGPFSFEYDIIDIATNERVVDTVKVTSVDSYEIETPKKASGREFQIKLSKITDKFSCAAVIDPEETFIVKSSPAIPKVQIKTAKMLQIVEGDIVNIPLDFSPPIGRTNSIKLEYKFADLHDQFNFKTRTLLDATELKVKDEGRYSLESFESDGCPGTIDNKDKTVTVTYFPRPNISVSCTNVLKQHKEASLTHLNSVCQNCQNVVKLKLEGAKPFIVDYEIKLPSGRVEQKSMNIDRNEISINLPTKQSGTYEHHFKGVYDTLYTKSKSKQGLQLLPSIRYDVHELPNAQFDSNNQFMQLCENKLADKDEPIAQIPILLTGKYPFNINASLTHERTGKTELLLFNNVEDPVLNLYSRESMTLGEHKLTVNHITDGNGCAKNEFSPFNSYIIVVTEVPNMRKAMSTKHVCVGDHILYNLTGIPPFTVYYKFNEKSQKADLAFNFQRLASKPGQLAIEALQDSSASRCLVNFTSSDTKMDSLKLKVHELPSVEVNKGDYIVEDIHEGDHTEITFTFEGVPPFKLTYTRTVDKQDGKKRRNKETKPTVEKHIIEDIWEYEHTVIASLEGTYEAIEVQDAFCRATKSIRN